MRKQYLVALIMVIGIGCVLACGCALYAEDSVIPTDSPSVPSTEMRSIPTLTHTIKSGETITKDDIEWSKQPAARLHGNVIVDAENLIGKSPRHMLTAHRAIRQDEITGATVVAKGARVAMVFRAGNLYIKTIGEALDNGASGEVVRVRNIESKAIVQGVVETAGLVRVGTPDANTAELP